MGVLIDWGSLGLGTKRDSDIVKDLAERGISISRQAVHQKRVKLGIAPYRNPRQPDKSVRVSREQISRMAGSRTSERKAAAARANGKLGGTHEVDDEMRAKMSESAKRRWARVRAEKTRRASLHISEW